MTSTIQQKNKRLIFKSIKNAPLHPQEQKRLGSLHRYQILDTDPETAFDDITDLLATICKTPIAWIGFIDKHRQWFKSQVGLSMIEIPREIAFCSHAILHPEQIMIISDTYKDDRFCDHPLVRSSPYIRFYAGAALVTPEGEPIGTIGVLDYTPRSLQANQLKALKVFAHKVMTELELRLCRQELCSVREQKKLESQYLQEITTKLAATRQTLEALTSAVSYDMRSPLRAIDSFSKVLLEDYGQNLDQDALEYLQRIQSGSHHLGILLEELWNLAGISRSIIQNMSCNLSILCEEIIGTIQDSISEKCLHFSCATAVMITADQSMIKIVLKCLLHNAWHLASHDASPRIEFGVIDWRGVPAYFVRSNGLGFNMSYQDKLALGLQQIYSISSFPGTAIGLLTVQRVIDVYGGEFWAEGKVGEGMTFLFTLPQSLENSQ